VDRHRPALTRNWALLLAVPPLAFLGLFFLWPVANILALGIAPDGQLQLGHIVETWAQPFVLDIVLFTLALAGLSTALTLLLGLPAAWVFARFDFPGRRVLRALTVVPFVLPTVVVGSAFLALMGPRSPLNALAEVLFGADVPQLRLGGAGGARHVAQVFYNIAVIIRLVGGMWAHIDPRSEEAARMLGASPWRTFREITWPLLRPAVISAASIVFLFTVTSFGVVLLLGGPRDTTLEVEIYRQTAVLLDLPTAAALTILQMVGIFALLMASAISSA
jgi:thiamine transport system permease protein